MSTIKAKLYSVSSCWAGDDGRGMQLYRVLDSSIMYSNGVFGIDGEFSEIKSESISQAWRLRFLTI